MLFFRTIIVCFVFFVSCSKTTNEKPVAIAPIQTLRVLSYSSFVGKDTLGELVVKKFENDNAEWKVKIDTGNDSAGLLARLRTLKSRGRDFYDLVIGLSHFEYQLALKENLIENGEAFNESPMAFIADIQNFPVSKWPTTWKEVPEKLQNTLLVQDPRSSSLGLTMLSVVFDFKWIDLNGLKKITRQIFPSWSSSYKSFLNEQSSVIWSFQTSEAYHLCNLDNKPIRYLAIPLQEGYPLHREYVARIKSEVTVSDSEKSAVKMKEKVVGDFVTRLLSAELQKEIPLKNWMLPMNKQVEMPKCFRDLSVIKGVLPQTSENVSGWVDQWSLQN